MSAIVAPGAWTWTNPPQASQERIDPRGPFRVPFDRVRDLPTGG
jgi:hypothetical protein